MTDLPDLSPEEAKAFAELQNEEAADSAADAMIAAGDSTPAPTPAPAPAPAAEQPFDATPTAAAFGQAEADRLAELDALEAAIWAKHDEGDLSPADARAQIKANLAEQHALQQQQQQAAAAIESDTEAWGKAVNGWFKDHREFAEISPENFAAFDQVVKSFTNSDLAEGLSFRQQLDEALAIYASRHPGVLKTTAKPATVTPEPKPEIPPTLARVPAADFSMADTDGTYAALDALALSNPERYEQQLAAMPAAQRDAFLASV